MCECGHSALWHVGRAEAWGPGCTGEGCACEGMRERSTAPDPPRPPPRPEGRATTAEEARAAWARALADLPAEQAATEIQQMRAFIGLSLRSAPGIA